MEKQEKNKTEQNPMPLGMILDHARDGHDKISGCTCSRNTGFRQVFLM